MKKLVFMAVVLAMIVGVSSETQAFLGFSKKAKVKNEQAENNMAVAISAFKEESEIAKLSIKKEGTGFSLLAGGAVVKTNTGGVLTTEISFGSSKVSLTVKTDDKTEVYRRYGGISAIFGVADIAVGDIISFEGVLNETATTLTITAKKIKDFSAQLRDAIYSGIIKTKGAETNYPKTFVLDIPANEKDLTVVVSATTTIKEFVKKGQAESYRTINFDDLAVGDIVKKTIGVVNTQTMRIIAKEITLSERDIQTREIKDVFAAVESVDLRNSMVVKTTSNNVYTVSFKNLDTVYKKWTISKKYSGVKDGSKTDGVTAPSTLDGLAIVATDKVWLYGNLDTKTNVVVPSMIVKEFYK